MSEVKAYLKLKRVAEVYQAAKEIAISFGASPDQFIETDAKLNKLLTDAKEKIGGGMIKESRYDWASIPPMFKFAAIDANGDEYAYVEEPTNDGEALWSAFFGEIHFIKIGENPCENWKDSLEKRPEQ